MEKTYWNRTMFSTQCNECGRRIERDEIVATQFVTEMGEIISTVEASKMNAKLFTFNEFCSKCKPVTNLVFDIK